MAEYATRNVRAVSIYRNVHACNACFFFSIHYSAHGNGVARDNFSGDCPDVGGCTRCRPSVHDRTVSETVLSSAPSQRCNNSAKPARRVHEFGFDACSNAKVMHCGQVYTRDKFVSAAACAGTVQLELVLYSSLFFYPSRNRIYIVLDIYFSISYLLHKPSVGQSDENYSFLLPPSIQVIGQ